MTEIFSRREVLKGLAKGVVAFGLGGCGQVTKETNISTPDSVSPAVESTTTLFVTQSPVPIPIQTREPTAKLTIKPTSESTPTVVEPTVVPTVAPTAEAQPTTPSETGSNIQSSLPDFRETQQVTSVEMEINGEKREFLGWRIGYTEVYVDKEFVSLDADFARGGHKNSGETILPNQTESAAAENIGKIGALVHAINLGLVQRSATELSPNWFEQYTQYVKDNPNVTYEMEGYLPIEGKEGTYGETKLGDVNPSLPVKFIFLPPRIDRNEAWERPDRIGGSNDRTPFHLAYATESGGYFQVDVVNGQLYAWNSEFTIDGGKLYSAKLSSALGYFYDLVRVSSLPSASRSPITSFGAGSDSQVYLNPFDSLTIADPGQWQRPYLLWQ